MSRNESTSAIVQSILRLAAAGAILTVALLAPNAVSALEKPLKKYLRHLDDQEKRQEIGRIVSYMKSQKLISGTYQHGLQITERGRQKLAQIEFENLRITEPKQWDHLWRIVFYDIPEKQKAGRDALTRKLQEIGFLQLQRSVLIHPFPCKEAIATIAAAYDIDEFVTYIETGHVDRQDVLIKYFKKQTPSVKFK